jgi:hypothetical protein
MEGEALSDLKRGHFERALRVKGSTDKVPKNIIEAAGEYFVSAELSRRGIIATGFYDNARRPETRS